MASTSRSSYARAAVLLTAVLLLASACAANSSPPNIPVEAGSSFVTEVPDSVNDVGRVPSVALDANGEPQIVYLLLTAKLQKGQIPPPVIAGQPQPPAVVLASQSKGIWTRSSVTKQGASPFGPAKGLATGISFKDGTAGPAVHTSVALDSQGSHHVAWSGADGLYYTDDVSGAFGDPQKVAPGETTGASLALGPDGSAWISFYQGSSLMAAHQEGSTWKTDTVAQVAGAGAASVVSAVRIRGDGSPVIAYGSGPTTSVATRSGATWTSRDVTGAGGYGVSLALDGNGDPHLAYYDAEGGVHHAHSVGGGPWQVDDLGTTKASPGGDPAWATGIALDGKGVHSVTWADTGTHHIVYATNRGGSFASQTLPDSFQGQTPSIAVTGDGKTVVVAWFDSLNQNLEVATNGVPSGQDLAFSPPPAPSAAPSSSGGGATCKPNGTTVNVVAKNIQFDAACLAAPANQAFKIDFDNQDAGTPHNLEVFTDSSASKALGGAKDSADFIIGPAKVTYSVAALPKGSYFFRCDIHPTQMTGTFVVS